MGYKKNFFKWLQENLIYQPNQFIQETEDRQLLVNGICNSSYIAMKSILVELKGGEPLALRLHVAFWIHALVEIPIKIVHLYFRT